MQLTIQPTATYPPNPAAIAQDSLTMILFLTVGFTILFFFLIKILFDLRSYRYR